MNYRSIYHHEKEKIVELFVGKSVVSVSHRENQWEETEWFMTLSDGTELEVMGSGCEFLIQGRKMARIISFSNIEPESESVAGESALAAALKPFGWTCTEDFWRRYYSDPYRKAAYDFLELAGQMERELDENIRPVLERG